LWPGTDVEVVKGKERESRRCCLLGDLERAIWLIDWSSIHVSNKSADVVAVDTFDFDEIRADK
jgi:hypothetical protein